MDARRELVLFSTVFVVGMLIFIFVLFPVGFGAVLLKSEIALHERIFQAVFLVFIEGMVVYLFPWGIFKERSDNKSCLQKPPK